MMYIVFDLSGKKILIVGATGRVGTVVANLFVELGADLIVHGRDIEKVSGLHQKLHKLHTSHHIEQCNFDLRDREELISRLKDLDDLDVLVNCAAFRPFAALEDISDLDWQTAMDVNITGAFLLSREVSKNMVHNQKSGSIVHIASIAGVRPLAYYKGAHYVASKGALIALVKALAQELYPVNIRVNAVSPGPISGDDKNDMFATHSGENVEVQSTRNITCQDVARACAFFASDFSFGVTGENLIIGG